MLCFARYLCGRFFPRLWAFVSAVCMWVSRSEQRSQGRSHVLHETLRGFVQRRDVSFMAKTLPSHVVKEEIVLKVTLTKKQKELTQKIFRECQ